MPWPWDMVRYCMDVKNGVFLHWPYPQKDWEFNQPFLDAMLMVWKALRHFQTDTTDWTPAHVDFEAWLMEDGGGATETRPLSSYERWLMENGNE